MIFFIVENEFFKKYLFSTASLLFWLFILANFQNGCLKLSVFCRAHVPEKSIKSIARRFSVKASACQEILHLDN